MRELQPSAVKWNRMLAILCCVAVGLWTVRFVICYCVMDRSLVFSIFHYDAWLEFLTYFLFACYLVANLRVNKWPLLAGIAIGLNVLSYVGINLFRHIMGGMFSIRLILNFALGILAFISVLYGMKWRGAAIAWAGLNILLTLRANCVVIADVIPSLFGGEWQYSYVILDEFAYLLFYLALLLFFIRNRIPALIKPSAKAKKKPQPPEKALRALKGDYEFGLLSTEEYAAARQEILAQL